MTVHDKTAKAVADLYGSDLNEGLSDKAIKNNAALYGLNVLSAKKKNSLIKRIFKALFEPMMIILLFALAITFGVNLGRFLKDGSGDFYECIGISIAVAISVTLTVIMEGKSEKAFDFLRAAGDTGKVKVIRNGKTAFVSGASLVVGDVVFCETGDKIPADGRIISCVKLKTDESGLTGESSPVAKTADRVCAESAPLAERCNMVFASSFVVEGSVKFIVTAVGNAAEMGKVATSVAEDKSVSAPLQEKLDRLGKFVSVFGLVCSAFVFVLSIIRLIITQSVTFDGVEDAFIRSIVLIVAAVPEGLPTTVTISLTLNVVRLAKSNALIRKLVATETVGCVSVICSDKTGTLTQNKMLVTSFVTCDAVFGENQFKQDDISLNCALNSTAELDGDKVYGSATEGALLLALKKSGIDYAKLRKTYAVVNVKPFSSETKYSAATVEKSGVRVTYYKGAPEVIFSMAPPEKSKVKRLEKLLAEGQNEGKRALAFAREKNGKFIFDGFALIGDKLREGIEKSVADCIAAGVKVKILTGDGIATATSIARSLALPSGENNVITAKKAEEMSREELREKLNEITVIARSTPETKLKVVTLLQESGEVVAVTGDGVNDAPAIKHADIGISMGSGSEVTKSASDIVLLDNSFDTILTAISFGRNVFDNFRRFITFQLNVNLASMAIIITYLILGLESPFTSTCLLWLNVIMDGPLALSLGLENRKLDLSEHKPVKRSADILNGKILLRIAVHAFVMCFVITLQELYNFLGVTAAEKSTVTVSLFVFFQLFNAVNCREVGSQSALKNLFDNKLLIIMLGVTYALHILIVSFLPQTFQSVRLEALTWLKITLICSGILVLSEAYKCVYRAFRRYAANGKIAKFSIMKRRKVT